MANEIDRKDTLRAGEQLHGSPRMESWNRDNNHPPPSRGDGQGYGGVNGGTTSGRGEGGSEKSDESNRGESPEGERETTTDNPTTTDSEQPRRKQRRGFAAMDPAKQREIASKGGKASHEQGTGHEWDSEAAREAGRKGGQASRGGRGKIRSEGPGGTGGTNQ